MLRGVLGAACAVAVAPFVVGGAAGRPAVVAIRVWPATGPAERATGTVVARGRVLTVDHVLEAGRRIEVEGADGVRRAATVLLRRPGSDLALLRVPGVTGPEVRFGDGGEGLRVLTVAGARPADLRRRIVARLVDQPGRPRRPSLDLAVPVAPGDSGAPVVDGDGAVVGVVYARSTRRDGTAYAVRGEALRRLAR
jgi:S1-C subfamily serine protease